MTKRFLTALVLVGYSVLLIKVVVFKGPLRFPPWRSATPEERAEAARPGRARGGQRGGAATESRDGRETTQAARAQPGPPLSTSRFSPLHANFIPFKTIRPQLRGRPTWSSALINLVGNTVLFVPVGFLVVLLYRNMPWPAALLLAVAVGVSMEVLEGILRVGVVDIDDVILNALGVTSGHGLGRLYLRRKDAIVARST